MTRSFWKGKKVFITGHTGFKGSWCALWLKTLGANVTGFSLPPPTTPNLFDLAKVQDEIQHVQGDIRDARDLGQCIAEAKPDVLIHMAAQTLVRASYSDPETTYSTNVMGTLNVLEAVRSAPSARALVMVTSDKCYENRKWPWGYREIDPLGGHDLYSSSKACAEILISSYKRSFFGEVPVFVGSARAGNTIGGGDWATDRLIPDIVRAVSGGQQLHLRYPRAVRPWQHVLDALRGYFTLAEKLHSHGRPYDCAWNFAPQAASDLSVQDLVKYFRQQWASELSWTTRTGELEHEEPVLKLDSSKARYELGFKPSLTTEHAMDLTIDWYRQYHAGEDPKTLTLGQISRYMNDFCPNP